jgi:hypothetical protein
MPEDVAVFAVRHEGKTLSVDQCECEGLEREIQGSCWRLLTINERSGKQIRLPD